MGYRGPTFCGLPILLTVDVGGWYLLCSWTCLSTCVDHCSFPARADRYHHELEAEDTEDEADDIMFHSFSSCSPRYSKVYSNFKDLKEVGCHRMCCTVKSCASLVQCQQRLLQIEFCHKCGLQGHSFTYLHLYIEYISAGGPGTVHQERPG